MNLIERVRALQRSRRTRDAIQARASSSPAPAPLTKGSSVSSTGTPPT
jgi:hypothetical protein